MLLESEPGTVVEQQDLPRRLAVSIWRQQVRRRVGRLTGSCAPHSVGAEGVLLGKLERTKALV